jgi:salicylate hydroxylase
LEKWTHDSGRVTLLGDACHPMLVRYIFFPTYSTGNTVDAVPKPYRAQGAAMSIEDAAVLGNLLSRISHISQLGPLLKAYQDLRLERAAEAQQASRINQRVFQLPDGEEQRRRDENMKKSMTSQSTGNRAELWVQPVANQKPEQKEARDAKLLGYDPDAEVDKWWASHGKDLEALV